MINKYLAPSTGSPSGGFKLFVRAKSAPHLLLIYVSSMTIRRSDDDGEVDVDDDFLFFLLAVLHLPLVPHQPLLGTASTENSSDGMDSGSVSVIEGVSNEARTGVKA